MLAAMAASVILVTATILIFYETLRLTSRYLTQLPIPARTRIIPLVLACFAAHTAAVWTYAGAYWLFAVHWRVPSFAGVPVEGLADCVYFSVVTCTSLGFGDHVPVEHARLIAGVEALNGLMLIGWSASFTYLAMERYWPMHVRRLRSADFTRPLGPDATSDWKVVEAGDQPRIRAAPGPRVR